MTLYPSLPTMHKHVLGQRMELIACHYLEYHGLQLQARNHHARLGELDLVMTDQDTCVFVEVRYRRSLQFGSPLESVTPRKQQRLILAARHYLMQHAVNMPCRFDIVGLSGPMQSLNIVWIRHAFDAS